MTETHLTLLILSGAWIGIAAGWCYFGIVLKRAICAVWQTALNGVAESIR